MLIHSLVLSTKDLRYQLPDYLERYLMKPEWWNKDVRTDIKIAFHALIQSLGWRLSFFGTAHLYYRHHRSKLSPSWNPAAFLPSQVLSSFRNQNCHFLLLIVFLSNATIAKQINETFINTYSTKCGSFILWQDIELIGH